MKKQLALGTLLFIAAFTLLGFIAQKTVMTACTKATVQVQDLGIFAYCKPDCQYEILGTVKLPGIVGSERADRCLETLTKRAKKEFPSCEALLLNAEFSRAECIRFKE